MYTQRWRNKCFLFKASVKVTVQTGLKYRPFVDGDLFGAGITPLFLFGRHPHTMQARMGIAQEAEMKLISN